jgi:hypothetical protein
MLPTAQANFKAWNEALATKDPKVPAKMYSTSALSFLPTLSPEHIKSLNGTEAYFYDFVKKDPVGSVTDESVQMYDGGKAYLHTGMYTFTVGSGDARAPVSARFSYMWKDYGGDAGWKITHHHSSVLPGKGAEDPPSAQNQDRIINLAAAAVAMATLAAVAALVAAAKAFMPSKDPAAAPAVPSRGVSSQVNQKPTHNVTLLSDLDCSCERSLCLCAQHELCYKLILCTTMCVPCVLCTTTSRALQVYSTHQQPLVNTPPAALPASLVSLGTSAPPPGGMC